MLSDIEISKNSPMLKINKIAEKTNPLSIDVINEIQNQFERILNEFSC